MTKFMFSALCAAALVTSVSAQGGKDMLSNGIKYLDVPEPQSLMPQHFMRALRASEGAKGSAND